MSAIIIRQVATNCYNHYLSSLILDIIRSDLKYFSLTLQGLSAVIEKGSKHSIEERSVKGSGPNQYETLAMMTCTSMAIKNGVSGWTYTIPRNCRYNNMDTCNKLCTSRKVTTADPQTRRGKWKSIGAVHVYKPRPSSNPPSTIKHASIGLKVQWFPSFEHHFRCGPNFCCCFVEFY